MLLGQIDQKSRRPEGANGELPPFRPRGPAWSNLLMGNFPDSVRLWALLFVAPAVSCAGTQAPPGKSFAQPIAPSVSYRPGPPLARMGGVQLESGHEAAGAVVRVAVVEISEGSPGLIGEPLELHSDILAATAQAEPWLASSPRLDGWIVWPGREFPAGSSFAPPLELACPVGSTGIIPLPPGFGDATLRLGARSSRALEVALAIGPQSDPHVALLNLRPRVNSGSLILAHTPEPPPGSLEPAQAWLFEVRAVSLADLDDGYARLAATGEQLAQAESAPHVTDREAQTLQLALEAIRSGDANRPAVVRLAELLRTPLAADLALILNEGELEEFIASTTESLGEQLGEADIDMDAAALTLERSAYSFALANAAKASQGSAGAQEQEQMDSRCANLLETHGGRAAAFPDSLADLLARATSLESLQTLLLDENKLWLTDSDPASRVVAFDWLARRAAAPEGFDPLASRTERRAALAEAAKRAESAALEASAQQPADGDESGAETPESND